ncbi:hypothetical protein GGR53DRAFT_377795 [Hypoxylon sp. FL1150]|nr:hypothetical protein GGR53DRAFT_377795 [Hypoxylon sp. FL1150]
MSFLSPYDTSCDQRILDYDFITEISPGVWKVRDKKNRVEWLAHEMTVDLYNPENDEPTAFRSLMSDSERIYRPMFAILSHDNLVRFKDWITSKRPLVGGGFEYRIYAVWDFCDAGNLGNLLVRPPVHTPGPLKRYPEDEPNTVDYWANFPEEEEVEQFLPESLCWHVLLSVMKALSWLHDGSWEMESKNGRFAMRPEPDWQPILHRNITPENIFLQHPEATEWYGPCKLGNYGNLYISGHHNGDGKESTKERHFSKPLAPYKMVKFTSLDDLALRDRNQGYSYPQEPDQPYTLISELRALGEIIQLMMLKPGTVSVTDLRNHSIFDNLNRAPYSALLKNTVALLMTYNPDEKRKDGSYLQEQRIWYTSMLCTTAHGRFNEWKQSGEPEGKKATLREDAIWKSQSNERVLQLVEVLRNQKMREVQAKDDRFEWSSFDTPGIKPRPSEHLPIANTSYRPFQEPEEITSISEEDEPMTFEQIREYIEKNL